MKERMGFVCTLAMLAGVLLGCDDRSLAMAPEKNGATSGAARRIVSSGAILRLGSFDGQSSREESPGWTRFTYDFWLDTTEVTQAEFQSLMGRNPSSAPVAGPSKPVVNSTWFDAILFCNARSKHDGLDTVYEYRSLSRDAGGSVWEIQGLVSRLERSGWRLPTEAEWEYAARAGSMSAYPWGELVDSAKAVEYAWYQKNAAGSLHEVARLAPNAWGFYDMAGNAMEWVQDWKGPFPKDTLTNFAGLDAPAEIPEASIKGGSYTYGLLHLRPSSRSATYATYRSAKAEYVGFRCARGGFVPSYVNASGQSVQAPPVAIVRPDLASLLGAQSARLVFLNRSNGKGVLSWIDFGEAVPAVRSLPDKDPVFHPVISPDGQWVAWCTVMEGSTGASRIKVRRLSKNDTVVVDLGEGAIPRWWVDGTDTFLVRANAKDNTSPEWSATSTTARRWSNGALTGSVETWSNSGGYHDGRSGRYLYTGYRRLRQYDVSSGRDRILFTYPQNGKRAGDTSQVCNASAAPDGSGRVLFLDFGYSGTSSVVGRPYGIHEVAFVSDSLGNIVKTVAVPEGKSQWDHLEWSNSSRWAVAMALESNSAYKEVHLLDLRSGRSEVVVRGDELWMPDLWRGPSVDLMWSDAAWDSSGAYMRKLDPSYQGGLGDAINEEFSGKASLFWMARDSVDVVFLGSSRTKLGVAPSAFKSGTSFNWGISGNELYGSVEILNKYVLPHAKNLKVVVLDFIASWYLAYNGRTTGYQDWKAITNTWGYAYDAAHEFWMDSVPAKFLLAVAAKQSDFGKAVAPFGEFPTASGGWATPPQLNLIRIQHLKTASYLENMRLLEQVAVELEAKGIKLLVVNFPVNPGYRNTKYADWQGPSWPIYDSALQGMKSLEETHANYRFYDANQNGLHDYSSEDAYNDGHLSSAGARKLTRRIDSILSGWK